MFFDDFKITHTKSPIISADDYYPFGLQITQNAYHRESGVNQNYKFQGQERQFELDLGWDMFRFRTHDPALGRFLQVDPLAEDYLYNSPYAFAENKLGLGVELEGLELITFEQIKTLKEGLIFKAAKSLNRSDGESLFVAKNSIATALSIGIAANVSHMARALDLNSEDTKRDEGSGINAFRHASGQAFITQNLGENIATQIGDAHENTQANVLTENQSNLNELNETGQTTISKKVADSFVDQLNNAVGRKIGKLNPKLGQKEIFQKVLEAMKDGKLFQFSDDPNNADLRIIKRSSLTDEQFDFSQQKLNNFFKTKKENE